MLKINRKWSVSISLALTVIAFAGLIAAAFFLPAFVGYLLSVPKMSGEAQNVSAVGHGFFLAGCYIILLFAMLGIALLFFLLLQVRKSRVFTPKAIALTRCISWCVFGIGLLFLPLSFVFPLLSFAAFACLLFGLCLRVVKNVLAEAAAIKSENDLTV